MKNILVYVNPEKRFDVDESSFRNYKSALVKVQIDNSLDLGWKSEDIILATNFPYEYHGIKSTIVPDELYCLFRPLSTKTITVNYLLENEFIDEGELCWAHDFDAYQLNKISEDEIGIQENEIGLTDYGWSPKWCLGSYFFKSDSADLFKLIVDKIYEHELEDERALVALTKDDTAGINERIKRLNITYNFGMRHVERNYKRAKKPIKVLHFHPYYNDTKLPESTLDCFMYGKNELNKPLMTKRLIDIFQHHGIK